MHRLQTFLSPYPEYLRIEQSCSLKAPKTRFEQFVYGRSQK